jgi:CHAD domain-containing protein
VGVATRQAAGEAPPVAGDASAGAPAEPAEHAAHSAAVVRIDLGEAPGLIEAGDTFAAAGRKAMWLHVDRMLAREPEIRDPDAVDSLRKHRVATRRLRAAMRLFREAYPAHAVKPLREGLGVLAREVGSVRDLDVRIADLDAWAAVAGADTAVHLAPLREEWILHRRQAADSLDRRLGTKGHRRLLERLVEFVTTEPSVDEGGAGGRRTVRDRVASSAWLAYERLRARAPAVDGADLATLHRIRIEAKRLRYTLEFLGPVMGPQREWLVARLVALQDHLGRLNDAAVNVAAVRAFLADRAPTLSSDERAATAAYLAAREQDVASLRHGVGRAWRPVMDASFAGRLGRAVIVVER